MTFLAGMLLIAGALHLLIQRRRVPSRRRPWVAEVLGGTESEHTWRFEWWVIWQQAYPTAREAVKGARKQARRLDERGYGVRGNGDCCALKWGVRHAYDPHASVPEQDAGTGDAR